MNLPLNVIVTQAVSLVAMLVAMFGVTLDDGTKAAIVSVILGLNTIVTFILHTWFNHPAAKAAIIKAAAEAYSAAKNNLPNPHVLPILFALMLVPALFLGGCSVLNNFFSNGSGPIGDSLTIVNGVQAAYVGLCPSGSQVSYCVSSKSTAKNLSAGVTLTASQLVNAYETGGNVSALETQLLSDITSWDNFLNGVNLKAARVGRQRDIASEIVTILGLLIPVGTDVYNAIVNAGGNYTNAQLNTLLQTTESQNNAIQAL